MRIYKYLILGDRGVGKTALVKYLLGINDTNFLGSSQINSYCKKLSDENFVELCDVYSANAGKLNHPLYGWEKDISGLIVVLDARASWENISICVARYASFYLFYPVQFVITHSEGSQFKKIIHALTAIWGKDKLNFIFSRESGGVENLLATAEKDESYKNLDSIALARFVEKAKSLCVKKSLKKPQPSYALKVNNITEPHDKQFANVLAKYMQKRMRETFLFSFNQATISKRSRYLQGLIQLIHKEDRDGQIAYLQEEVIQQFKGVFSHRLYDLLKKRREYLLEQASLPTPPALTL